MSDGDKIKAVEYVGEVYDVKTMADHTFRVTFVLPEYCADQAAWFLKHHHDGIKSITQLENLSKLDGKDKNQAEKKTKGSGHRLDSRRLRDRRDQSAGG